MLGNIHATSHLESEISPNPELSVTQKRNLVLDFIMDGLTFDYTSPSMGFREYRLHAPPLRGLELNFTLSCNNRHLHRQALEAMGGGDPEPPQGDMHIQDFNLGDKDLYGQGFGTFLLRRALIAANAGFPLVATGKFAPEEGEECAPQLTIMSTGPANLPLLNTLAKVGGGYDNVSARAANGIRYGNGTDRSLEDAISDTPFDVTRSSDKNYRYLFHDVEVAIDPAELALNR